MPACQLDLGNPNPQTWGIRIAAVGPGNLHFKHRGILMHIRTLRPILTWRKEGECKFNWASGQISLLGLWPP